MGKIKKSKQNINVNGQLNANSVFDDLFNLFGRQERNFEDLEGILMEGLKHIGEENFVQELCLRLTKLQPEEDSTPIIWALEAIGNETVIRKLRNLLKNSDFSSRIHFEAGMVLNALGQSVDLGRLSPMTSGDLQTILKEIEREVNQVSLEERMFSINDLLDQVGRYMGPGDLSEMQRLLVNTLKDDKRQIAVDIVWTLQEFGLDKDVCQLAGEVVRKMRKKFRT